MGTKLAFITYETPFASAGGVAAVIGRLPIYVKNAANLETVVLTPYHHSIARTASLATADKGTAQVMHNHAPLSIRLRHHNKDVSWYFVAPESPLFFAGHPHPYLVGAQFYPLTHAGRRCR
jgi:glycogen synthase